MQQWAVSSPTVYRGGIEAKMMDSYEVGDLLDEPCKVKNWDISDLSVPTELPFSAVEKDAFNMRSEYYDILALNYGKAKLDHPTRDLFRRWQWFDAFCSLAEAIREHGHGRAPHWFVSFYFENWPRRKNKQILRNYRKQGKYLYVEGRTYPGLSYPSLKAIATDSLGILPGFLLNCSRSNFAQHSYLGCLGMCANNTRELEREIVLWCKQNGATSDKDFWLQPEHWLKVVCRYSEMVWKPFERRMLLFKDEIEAISGTSMEEILEGVDFLRKNPHMLNHGTVVRITDLTPLRDQWDEEDRFNAE